MTATFAPSPWPAPAAARRDAGWRFGRELPGAEQGAARGWRFDLRRNMSLTPRQLGAAYLMLCTVSLAVAGGFWWHGVAMVGVFTGLELVAVGIALMVVARHAGDCETITLGGGQVAVEQHFGPGLEHTMFRAEWLRVEPAGDDGSLVELSGEGRSVRIGRHVRPELRVELAEELRRALRLTRNAGEGLASRT